MIIQWCVSKRKTASHVFQSDTKTNKGRNRPPNAFPHCGEGGWETEKFCIGKIYYSMLLRISGFATRNLIFVPFSPNIAFP